MSQSLSNVYIHLIFSTKDRKPWLAKRVRAKLNAYVAGILKQHDCIGIEIQCVEDHIHILFRLGRTISIADIVGEVKTGSSKHLKTLDGAMQHFAWQHGYGAFSVSESNIQEVRRYIQEQEQHHARMSFQDEYRAFLRKHGVEFNETYVWN
jgi:putative transposase